MKGAPEGRVETIELQRLDLTWASRNQQWVLHGGTLEEAGRYAGRPVSQEMKIPLIKDIESHN